MPRHSVLIVEDDPDTAQLIKHTFERTGDLVATIVSSGEEALTAVSQRLPDAIVLDVRLPKMDGLEVCRTLRARADTRDVPIVMLTARIAEEDRVAGFEHGADDYVTKPFSPRELRARVRAVIRRGATLKDVSFGPASYKGTELVADFEGLSVTVAGRRAHLTKRELELLRYFVWHKDRVVSRERLLADVWGYDASVETRSIDVHVARLRTKLGVAGRQIETVVGMGYRFVD